jgi:hypothetical protein
MLDRKAMLILSALILVMVGGAIWHVTHAARASVAPFLNPLIVTMAAGVLVLKERRATASADALAAWKKWGGFFMISCAAIVTAFQLLPVFRKLGAPLPPPELVFRLLIAGYGLVLVVAGDQAPKLPPLEWRRPGVLSLGKAEQLAMLRLGGWLFVCLGLVTFVSALLLPVRLIAAVMGSLVLAMLVVMLAKRRQLTVRH